MPRATRSWSIAVACVLCGAAALAQEPPPPELEDPGPLTTMPLPPAAPWASHGQPPYFRHTDYGALPQPAPPCTPAAGHDSYVAPPRHYGPWYRPAAFAEDAGDNCRTTPWAPRGYGFPHRKSCERMDYYPYQLTTYPSMHGPAYYANRYREPCCNCKHAH
jgi:hypothetical protein